MTPSNVYQPKNNRPENNQPVFSCAEIRRFDRLAAEQLGVPSLALMENAGRSLTDRLLTEAGDELSLGPILVLCGKGNNGGDGLVMARRLASLGFRVETILLYSASAAPAEGDAAIERHIVQKLVGANLSLRFFDADPCAFDALNASLRGASWVVDALLGSGGAGRPKFPYDRAISLVNASGRPVFAVDLPSGLCGDTGRPFDGGESIIARVTCTLAALKTGLTVNEAARRCGRIFVGDIGLSVAQILSADRKSD